MKQNLHNDYITRMGSSSYDDSSFEEAVTSADALMSTIGVRSTPDSSDVHVGVDFQGNPVYSNAALANDNSTDKGYEVSRATGVALGAMGAFENYNEAGRFIEIGNKSGSQEFLTSLDTLKANNDIKGFNKALGGENYSNYKLFENWSNLSSSQKSLGASGAQMQNFRFDSGQGFKEKKLTPAIPDVPQLNAKEGLELAVQGVNVAPATRKWNQLSALQETQFMPSSATDVVNTANQAGVLGFGLEGKAVPIDEQVASSQNLSPTPQYGIGAASIPLNQGAPEGYSILRQVGDKNIIIPTANRGSAILNAPEVASESARVIYDKWDNTNARQTQGTLGGSALHGGLDSMTSTNPYALGAIVTHATLANTPPADDATDMEHVTYLAGVSLNRLIKGKTDQATDKDGASYIKTGEFTRDNYDSTMKQFRGDFAKGGISSKEIGYQLANQGYAENRFDESQTVALHRVLDMVFDDNSFPLAQKLSTGKTKGLEIIKRRNRG